MLPAGSKLALEFKAGKMSLDGKTLKPDARKGTVRVLRVGTWGIDRLVAIAPPARQPPAAPRIPWRPHRAPAARRRRRMG
jgi:hypothetical protein